MKVGGLVEQCHLILYTITSLDDQPGTAADILSVFAAKKINLEYLTEGTCQQNHAVISFCVDMEIGIQVDEIIKADFEENSLAITKKEYVCILGIYGPHFREKPGIAATFCRVLGRAQVNILGISSSISTISCIVDIRDHDRAKHALLSYFEMP